MRRAFGREKKTRKARRAQSRPGFDLENVVPEATDGTGPLVSEVHQKGRVRANTDALGPLCH